jgi:hypothetical protein
MNASDDGDAARFAGRALVADIQMVWTFHALSLKTERTRHNLHLGPMNFSRPKLLTQRDALSVASFGCF